MPPAAATECERTGWTLLMIATEAPSSAAARAARWPASPAPMIRTSCDGMAPALYRSVPLTRPVPGGGRTVRPGRSSAVHHRPGDGCREGAADVLERDHAAQPRLGVDHHQRPEAPQRLGGQELLDRRLAADDGAGVDVRVEHLADGRRGAAVVHRAVDRLAPQDAHEAPEAVDDREPREPVAQEEVVVGVEDAEPVRDRDRLGVHDVGDRHAVEALGEAAGDDLAAGGLGEEPAEHDEPDPAEP